MKKHKKIIAIQGDPLNSLNRRTDTTLLLALEAQKRGYKIYYYETKNLTFSNGTNISSIILSILFSVASNNIFSFVAFSFPDITLNEYQSIIAKHLKFLIVSNPQKRDKDLK